MFPYIIAVLLAVSSPDTTIRNDNPVELDPITVIGKRSETRLSKTVNSTIVINPEKIKNITTDNLLTSLDQSDASLTISKTSPYGFGLGSSGHGKINIRGLGFSPNRGALVLIDGRPDIAGLFGHPLPDTYRQAGLYEAEILKGSSSTLYGSNAIGGVMNLQSFYRPDLNRYTNLKIATGSFDTYQTVAQHSQKFGKVIAAGWYEYLESDNHRINNEYFNRSGGIRLQFVELKNWNLFMTGRFSSFDFNDPGRVDSLGQTLDERKSWGDIIRTGATLGADYRTRDYSLSLRLYNSYGEHSFSDGFNSVDRNNGVDLFGRINEIGSSAVALSGGLSINLLGGSAYNGTTFINQGDFSETEKAAHFQLEKKIGNLLNLVAGGRYIDHNRYDGHFVYQFGAVISPDNIGSFKLSYGTSYRNPTVNESQLFLTSNSESLQPEEGRFFEIGYFKALNRFSFETAFFYREGENLITTLPNPTPPPMVKFQNSGSYYHNGVETKFKYFEKKFSLEASYAYLNQDDYNLSVPKHKFVLTGLYEFNQDISLSANLISAFETASELEGEKVILDNYAIVNLDFKYNLPNLIKINFELNNLLDKSYQTVAGYPQAGRYFKISFNKEIL